MSNRYLKAFQKHGASHKALLWKTEDAARVRYENLVQDIDFDGKSVMDIGCGFGDIIPYIAKKTTSFSYAGIDLMPEFVTAAQKKYPHYQFIAGDYKKLLSPTDIILCSGALNSNTENPLEDRKEAIELMWNNTKEVLAFNMAGGHPQPKNSETSNVYYVDSLDILNFCFTLTSKVVFRHHYRKTDFTVILFR